MLTSTALNAIFLAPLDVQVEQLQCTLEQQELEAAGTKCDEVSAEGSCGEGSCGEGSCGE